MSRATGKIAIAYSVLKELAPTMTGPRFPPLTAQGRRGKGTVIRPTLAEDHGVNAFVSVAGNTLVNQVNGANLCRTQQTRIILQKAP